MRQNVNQHTRGLLDSLSLVIHASRTLPIALTTLLATSAGLPLMANAVMDQPPARKGEDKPLVSNAQLLDDFAHYVLISNYEMARSAGEELMSRGLSNIDMMKLVDDYDPKRFESVVQRAIRAQDEGGKLQATAGKLLTMYEKGRLEQARNPDQIAQNIAALTGQTARGRLLGRAGLVHAGEYAVPQLLTALTQTQDAELAAQAQSVLAEMGRQAIMPLSTAMMKLPPAQQERIVRVLGLIPYKQSLPFLADLRDSTDSPNVRAECVRSIERLGGATGDVPSMYRQLAEGYYNEKSEVTSFPNEDYQLLWSYMPAAGLVATAIRTPVFHEAVSMNLLERAMQLEQAGGRVNPDTLALWVASNYSREFDTPQGYVNPAYPVEGAAGDGQTPRRSAEYFGVASGPVVSQRVLARAINDLDTPLARRSLAAVEKTAGGRSVLDSGAGRSPLAAALVYPNRRVQIDAALAIAAAQPMAPFVGAERVVPTLAGSIRGVTDMYAAIVTSDTERYQNFRKVLESAGFKVLPQGSRLGELEGAIAEAPAIDLVVGTGLSVEGCATLVGDVRGGAKTAATPVLLMASQDVYIDQSRRYASDRTIAVRPAGINSAAITQTVQDLVQDASGGAVSGDEAAMYATRSLGALRDLAVANNPVLRVADAAPSLLTTLNETKGQVRLDVADVLARIPQERAQRAIMDAALSAEGEERVAMLGAVSASAKRFGSMLEPRHITRLIEIAKTGGEREATAAASLMGALNLPNVEMLPLILGSEVAQR